MEIDLLHGRGACSTLILFKFDPEMKGTWDVESESFFDTLKYKVSSFRYNSFQGEIFPAQDFAFMVASTSHRQPVAEECLRKLGFTESERVTKNKNPDHEVKFWVIPIPTLFSNLGLES